MLEGARALALKLKPVYAPFVYMCMHMLHVAHVNMCRPTVLRETGSDRSSCVCGVPCAHWSILVRFTGPVTGNVPVNGLMGATTHEASAPSLPLAAKRGRIFFLLTVSVHAGARHLHGVVARGGQSGRVAAARGAWRRTLPLGEAPGQDDRLLCAAAPPRTQLPAPLSPVVPPPRPAHCQT